MNRPKTDYYALLGVAPGASGAAIRAAFRRLAKELHPDASHSAETADRFRLIVEAYDVLSDPARRVAYDATYWRGGMDTRVVAPRAPAAGVVARTAPIPGAGQPRGGVGQERGAATSTPAQWAPQPGSGFGQGSAGSTRTPGRPVVPTARPARRGPGAPRREAGPVTPVAPVGAISAGEAGARLRRAAAIGRSTAVRTRCVECGAQVLAGSDRCPKCLEKYGSFSEHLARAAARLRR